MGTLARSFRSFEQLHCINNQPVMGYW
jgi:hypothetical protein